MEQITHLSSGIPGVRLIDAEHNRFSFPRHFHLEYHIGLLLQGRHRYAAGGERRLAGAGDALLMAPESIHDGSSAGEEGYRIRVLALDADWLERASRDFSDGRRGAPRLTSSLVRDERLQQRLRQLHLGMLGGAAALENRLALEEHLWQALACPTRRTSPVCSVAPTGYRRRACASAESRFPFRSLFRGVAMQELSVLLTLAAVFAVALVSPGPDVALVVRTSLHQGRRAGLASALGLACGILLHTTLVLTGVSLLLSRTPVLFAILQALGALYLAWLGVGALRAWLRRGDGQPGRLDGALPPSPLGPWLRGVATNLFNPKALVFFIALLGSLIPAQMSLGGKLAVAALLFGMGACWFGLLSLTLTRPALQARLLRAMPWLDAACGVVFLLVAAAILEHLVRSA